MKAESKRWIAAFAALQILLYHCWIPVFPAGSFLGEAERFFLGVAYVGVDAFFFISAFSLVSRPVEDYPAFLKDRARKILPLFLIAWALGQFLWFLPSIMLVYVFLPPLYRTCRERPVFSFFLLFAGWAALTGVILGIIRPEQDLGIFLFRIPSVILGAYAVRFKDRIGPRGALLTGLLLVAIGSLLTHEFGYLDKLDVPFRGSFYLTGIPLMLGQVLLLGLLGQRKGCPKAVSRFGGMTLELYFTQMLLGSCLVSFYYRLTKSRLVTDLAVLTLLIVASAALQALERSFPKLPRLRPEELAPGTPR